MVITRFGKPVAAVIKYDDYDRFMNPRKKFIKKSFLENNEKQDKKTPQEKKKAIKETLALAGSWGALDWNEMEKELTRIRQGNKPTPPIELKDI